MNKRINVIKTGSNFNFNKMLVIIIVLGVLNGKIKVSIELLIGRNNINIPFFSPIP
jgi:hypothetical protein